MAKPLTKAELVRELDLAAGLLELFWGEVARMGRPQGRRSGLGALSASQRGLLGVAARWLKGHKHGAVSEIEVVPAQLFDLTGHSRESLAAEIRAWQGDDTEAARWERAALLISSELLKNERGCPWGRVYPFSVENCLHPVDGNIPGDCKCGPDGQVPRCNAEWAYAQVENVSRETIVGGEG